MTDRDPNVRDDDYLKYVSRLSCLVCSQLGIGISSVSDPAHVKSRGAGGGDRGNTVPLCRTHHIEQHKIGIKSFELRYSLDLEGEAIRIDEAYTPADLPF